MSIMKQILYLQPVLRERLWGGTRLAEFRYQLPSDHVGECWGVSAYPDSCCVVRNGIYAGRRLDDLWREEPALFGRTDTTQDFPLLIKIIDAHDDLSIQVHPDDEYARIHENGACGKTECWYVLDAEPGATIVIGHHAKDKEELSQMIHDGRFRDLIREVPVKAGDFFQIEPGTVHAIKAGTMGHEVFDPRAKDRAGDEKMRRRETFVSVRTCETFVAHHIFVEQRRAAAPVPDDKDRLADEFCVANLLAVKNLLPKRPKRAVNRQTRYNKRHRQTEGRDAPARRVEQFDPRAERHAVPESRMPEFVGASPA